MAFVIVEGEVTRLHNSGGGFGLKESWDAQGKQRSRFWAVFPKEPVSVSVGDRVKVSGGLQTSVTDPKPDQSGQDRYYVDHVAGQAKVEVSHASQGGSGSGWGSPAGVGSSGEGFGPQNADPGFGGGFDEQPF